MKKLYFIITVLSALLGTAACSQKTDSKEAVSVAVDYGKAHAQRLLDAYPDTTKMQLVLLETRAREEELRSTHHEQAADKYIEAFEKFVRQNNDTLAAAIFDLPYVK